MAATAIFALAISAWAFISGDTPSVASGAATLPRAAAIAMGAPKAARRLVMRSADARAPRPARHQHHLRATATRRQTARAQAPTPLTANAARRARTLDAAALASFAKPATRFSTATVRGGDPTAHAAAANVTITAAVSGSGTATISDANPAAKCNGATTCVVVVGDTIVVTATADSGSRLAGWSGGTCTAVTNPCTFTAAATETDTAKFAKTVTITANATGNGSAKLTDANALANCTAVSSCLANVGDAITITATPLGGNHWVSWSGGSCATVNPCAPHRFADRDRHGQVRSHADGHRGRDGRPRRHSHGQRPEHGGRL